MTNNSRYTRETHSLKAINRGLMVSLIAVSVAFMGVVALAFKLSSDQIAYVPPDTSNGAKITLGEPDKPNVYGFANYITQYLYHWPENGADDFKQNIFDLSYYITPAYKGYLEQEYRLLTNRSGINEIEGRQRSLQPVSDKRYTSSSVKKIADGVWDVYLYYRLNENYKRESIKDVEMKYILRVVKSDVDIERNQWGLQLDGPREEPSRLAASN